MESMSDIVWAINPVNDNFEQLIVKMREFAADMLEPLKIRYEFVQKGDPSQVKGFDTTANSQGNGLRNMRKRAEQMVGHVDITSEKGKGTTVHLQVKLRK